MAAAQYVCIRYPSRTLAAGWLLLWKPHHVPGRRAIRAPMDRFVRRFAEVLEVILESVLSWPDPGNRRTYFRIRHYRRLLSDAGVPEHPRGCGLANPALGG